MSFPLDETDIAILEALIKDGRKSFRQIAREIKVSTQQCKYVMTDYSAWA